MDIQKTIQAARAVIDAHRLKQGRIVLIPTMGALHPGHLALVRHGRALDPAALVVVSIFVNPSQFDPNEDFRRYPRTLSADLDSLDGLAADAPDLVFAPADEEFYPPDFSTQVVPGPMAQLLCGASRARHFEGVCTVVTLLLRSLKADVAVFGEKDFQQLAIIRRMVKDLWLDTDIVGHAIVRHSDGLALSSRNRHLTPSERQRAPALHQCLKAMVQLQQQQPELNCSQLLTRGQQLLAGEAVEPEYLELVAADSLTAAVPDRPLPDRHPHRAMVAARFGDTRLIDNMAVGGSNLPKDRRPGR